MVKRLTGVWSGGTMVAKMKGRESEIYMPSLPALAPWGRASTARIDAGFFVRGGPY